MGRPRVTEQRAEEILDAFEICVAHYGVEGATLERLAEQAGLARALIRHHIGNRDELVTAFVDRFIRTASEASQVAFEQLPPKNKSDVLVAGFFDPELSDPHRMRVISALLIAMTDRPELSKKLRVWTLEFIASLAEVLHSEFPARSTAKVKAVATGIAGLYFNVDTFAAIGDMKEFRHSSYEAALLLLETLRKKG